MEREVESLGQNSATNELMNSSSFESGTHSKCECIHIHCAAYANEDRKQEGANV